MSRRCFLAASAATGYVTSGGRTGAGGAALPTADIESGEYVAAHEEPPDKPTVERDGEPLVAFDAMWFAWAAFYPETEACG